MHHSIVIAYRNRADHLKALLECFSHCAEKERAEIILVDLNSTDHTPKVLRKFRHLNIKHHFIPYAGTFHKTKAINFGVLNASADLVTVHDIDCLPAPDYLANIHKFFADPQNRKKRLCRDMIYLDYQRSLQVKRLKYDAYSKWLFKAGGYKEDVCVSFGTSQTSLMREHYDAIGGFDEGFVGYGFEDHHFNHKAYLVLGRPIMLDTVWHLHHNREPNWSNPETDVATRERYKEWEQQGFPLHPISEDYGKFDVDERSEEVRAFRLFDCVENRWRGELVRTTQANADQMGRAFAIHSPSLDWIPVTDAGLADGETGWDSPPKEDDFDPDSEVEPELGVVPNSWE